MAQAVDVAELAFPVEDFLGPFAGEAEGAGERAEEFDDLRDVVVVFAVFRAGLGIEEVVACYEFEDLGWGLLVCGFVVLVAGAFPRYLMGGGVEGIMHTIAAILHTSVLAPHFDPRMTSGERYCRVWMSLVKWCPTQQALPKSAILTEIVSIEDSGSSVPFFSGVTVLLSEMPEISWVKMSLNEVVSSLNSLTT